MRYHALLGLLAVSAYAAPLLQPRDNNPSKDFEKAYKQMGKAYDNAVKEFNKSAGKGGGDLSKAYSEYAKQAGELAEDARQCTSPILLT